MAPIVQQKPKQSANGTCTSKKARVSKSASSKKSSPRSSGNTTATATPTKTTPPPSCSPDRPASREAADAEFTRAEAHKEQQLREEAVEWMTDLNWAWPNGTRVSPPPWFRRDSQHRSRPAAWIKDHLTGDVRPRRLTDDMVDAMTPEKRAEWIQKRKHMASGRKA